MKSMKKVTVKNMTAVVVSCLCLGWVLLECLMPACLVRTCRDESVVQTILDHRLPRLHTAYIHTGKPELVVTKPWDNPVSNSTVRLFWCKVVDKDAESAKSIWRKFGDRIASMVRFMAFDEKGALVLTEHGYAVEEEVRPGEYVYLGMLRTTVHLEGYGTGVWEFPCYVDRGVRFGLLNSILGTSEAEIIEAVRNVVHATVEPAQSYKVNLVERGATRRESWQPWLKMSCDVTLEYIGDGTDPK